VFVRTVRAADVRQPMGANPRHLATTNVHSLEEFPTSALDPFCARREMQWSDTDLESFTTLYTFPCSQTTIGMSQTCPAPVELVYIPATHTVQAETSASRQHARQTGTVAKNARSPSPPTPPPIFSRVGRAAAYNLNVLCLPPEARVRFLQTAISIAAPLVALVLNGLVG
jgi:hypothetical protein